MKSLIDRNRGSDAQMLADRRGAQRRWSRLVCTVAVLTGLTGAAVQNADAQQSRVQPPAPTCTAQLPLTLPQTEGPFYKAGSPQRTRLTDAMSAGTKLIVTGYVLAHGSCRPIAGAWLDFWQADDQGHYDTVGYRLRGHQFTNTAGIYYLETIVPGLYPGRTRHLHVKVRAPNGPVLTTQLYFPDEGRNQSDAIFNRSLLASTRDGSEGKIATFTFIVNTP